jgi:hypothetical protein
MSVRFKLTYILKEPEETLIDDVELFPKGEGGVDLPDIPQIRILLANQFVEQIYNKGFSVVFSSDKRSAQVLLAPRIVKLEMEFSAISLATMDQVPPIPDAGNNKIHVVR